MFEDHFAVLQRMLQICKDSIIHGASQVVFCSSLEDSSLALLFLPIGDDLTKRLGLGERVVCLTRHLNLSLCTLHSPILELPAKPLASSLDLLVFS